MDSHVDPRFKFSFDRTTCVNGRALEYGSVDQTIVAASLFANCFFGARDPQQRATYLHKLEQDWESGIAADSAILQLQHGYDADVEQAKAWTSEWERLEHHAHIDRIFNTDGYHLSNCIFVEGEINFAKSTMSEFASSASFKGESKISFAIDILRTAVTELLDLTRPHRAGPPCFWTGVQLSMDSHVDPRFKFSFDRTTCVNGRALEYGSVDQTIVAASLFANCFFGARDPQQRATYLHKLEQDWESGIAADSAILQLQHGYDADVEQAKAWTPEWEARWKQFVQRSLTPMGTICPTISLWRAKSVSPNRQSAFKGECKISFAIDVLRTAVTELLDLTRPHRAGWTRRLRELKENKLSVPSAS
ncbi:MAG: hypothetical protein J3Q66DRAFT_399523 [Benniella sp.]|nr:MAG: hypothetical protein J3Q66DRAFT_399523 [Benniella sp.]